MVFFELDAAYRLGMTQRIQSDIGYARYRAGAEWHRAEIQWSRLDAQGVLETAFLIGHSVSGEDVVTGVELVSRSGARIGGVDTHIERAGSVEGILYIVRMQVSSLAEESASVIGMTVLA